MNRIDDGGYSRWDFVIAGARRERSKPWPRDDDDGRG